MNNSSILLILFLFISVNVFSQENTSKYEFSVEIEGIKDTVAYLGHHFGNRRYVDDTASIVNNKAVFQGNKDLKEGLYFFYSGSSYLEFIIDDDKQFRIKTNLSEPIAAMEVEGSDQNVLFQKMQVYVNGHRKQLQELNSKLESGEADSIDKSEVSEEIKRLDREVKDYQLQIAEENQGKLISRMMYAMQKPEIPENSGEMSDKDRYYYYKNSFFKNFDISDEGLLRTPLYLPKVLEYLDEVISQNADTVINEIDKMLDQASSNDEVYRFLLVTLSSKYENAPIMGQDKVFVHLVDNYYLTDTPEWLDPEVKKNLEERVATMRYSFIGMEAPKMVLNDTSKNNISLYGINADYTILYFYDPDCGHCKKKTPVMLEAYHNLKEENKSIEVLAINITTNEDRWKEYINELNLDWINLADSFNRSNFRYYYDIRSTPTIYILDDAKKIIAKKLDASQVEDFINESIRIGMSSSGN